MRNTPRKREDAHKVSHTLVPHSALSLGLLVVLLPLQPDHFTKRMATKRLGILTSGGDAPGMNPAIRAVVRAALARSADVFAICEGYQGLVEGGDKLRKVDWSFVSGIMNKVYFIFISPTKKKIKINFHNELITPGRNSDWFSTLQGVQNTRGKETGSIQLGDQWHQLPGRHRR